jgi:hypothetical protein
VHPQTPSPGGCRRTFGQDQLTARGKSGGARSDVDASPEVLASGADSSSGVDTAPREGELGLDCACLEQSQGAKQRMVNLVSNEQDRLSRSRPPP